jgi:AraC-like DNA-binding protein
MLTCWYLVECDGSQSIHNNDVHLLQRVYLWLCSLYEGNLKGGGLLAGYIPSGQLDTIVASLAVLQRNVEKVHSSIPRRNAQQTLATFGQYVQQGKMIQPNTLLQLHQEQAEAALAAITELAEQLLQYINNGLQLPTALKQVLEQHVVATIKWCMYGGLPTMRQSMLLLNQVCQCEEAHNNMWCVETSCLHTIVQLAQCRCCSISHTVF